MSKDKEEAGRILMDRAREAIRIYGKDDDPDSVGWASRRVARREGFQLTVSNSVNQDGAEVQEIVVVYDGSLRLKGRIIRNDADPDPKYPIYKCDQTRWRKYFFSAFPVYVDRV